MIMSITGCISVMAEFHRAQHFLFGQLMGLGFDHHHGVLGAGDTRSRRCSGFIAQLVHVEPSGFSTYSAINETDARGADRTHEGHARDGQRGQAAIMATISGSLTRSCDSTVHMTRTSFLKPGANSGRQGRSIRRAVSVSFRSGAPRAEKAAGILPAA